MLSAFTRCRSSPRKNGRDWKVRARMNSRDDPRSGVGAIDAHRTDQTPTYLCVTEKTDPLSI